MGEGRNTMKTLKKKRSENEGKKVREGQPSLVRYKVKLCREGVVVVAM